MGLLREGISAEEAVARLTGADRAQRQLGIVDGEGRAASYTGSECHGWAGHRTGDGYAAQGNRLFGLHHELFGKTPRDKWIEVDDGLRKEIDDRLAVLGYERLDDWAGAANLEERVDGEEMIDPVVLDALRHVSN